MSDAELVIGIGKAVSQVTGTANLSARRDHLRYKLTMGKTGLILLGRRHRHRLGPDGRRSNGVDVSGKLGGKLVYAGDISMQNSNLTLILDLTGYGSKCAGIELGQAAGRGRRASMKLVLRNGCYWQIDRP